jgi:hypothetical protein
MSLHNTAFGAFLMCAAFTLPASGAGAATINLHGDKENLYLLRGMLQCSPSCEGLMFNGDFSTDRADLFTVQRPNPKKELNFVNGQTGEFFETSVKTEKPGKMFSSAAAYILLKIGGGNSFNEALIHNTSGGVLEFTYKPAKGTGSGLSHITEYGDAAPAPVPLPAAGGLLAAGMTGLLFLRRRRTGA